MKTQYSAPKTPKITCVDEIPYTPDYSYFKFLASQICEHYKDKSENKISRKKCRDQKAACCLISKNSKYKQAYRNEYFFY